MTRSREDYMKAILYLDGENRYVSNKQLSEQLNVNAASVTDMVMKLDADGYIDYRPYNGVKLTEKGKQYATRVLRNHRVWEAFLCYELGYQSGEVHNDAEILEHYVSDEFINRLDAYLGYPETCPHGYPIPREIKKEDAAEE